MDPFFYFTLLHVLAYDKAVFSLITYINIWGVKYAVCMHVVVSPRFEIQKQPNSKQGFSSLASDIRFGFVLLLFQ
jgi:hypothetical protein